MTEKFPITILKGLIKVYRCRDGDGSRYKIVWQTPNGKKQVYRKSLKDAKSEAETLRRKVKSGSTDNVILDPVEQADYRAALAALKPAGTGLRIACEEHAEVVKILGGNHILEAARFYAKRNIHSLPKIAVKDACQSFIDSIDRVPYQKFIRTNLKRFSKSFHMDLKSARSHDIDEFIRALKLAERSKKNVKMAISALFTFSVSRGWIPRDNDVMNGVRSYGDGDGEILIYSVAEMEKLMHSARPEIVPWLAIAAFPGLRHAEIQRLDWADIDDDFITVGKAKSKTRTRRLVPVAGNLKTWLKPFQKPSGPVSQFSIVCNQFEKVSKSSGVKWKKNGLRHSYISYRLAETQDVNSVAIEAGNSPAIIFSNYRQLVRPDEATKWFSIVTPT